MALFLCIRSGARLTTVSLSWMTRKIGAVTS